MMRIVYRKIAGVASDVRFADEGYVLQASELEAPAGDTLPTPDSLTDAAVFAARSLEASRLGTIDGAIAANTLGSVTPKTVAELKAMTAAEFSPWFDANVTSAAQAIALLKRLALIIIRRVL
jgi:hypothetical protein